MSAHVETSVDTPRQRFEAMAGWILDCARRIGRRAGLAGPDLRDFASWVAVRLIRRDYAVLRACRSRQRLRGYLGMVIRNLAKDYRNHLWGKWRPSAAAKRLGRYGVELERLCIRDELPIGEAIELLRRNLPHSPDADELEAMACKLPLRPRRSHVEFDPEKLGWQLATEPDLTAPEARDTRIRVRAGLQTALAGLAERDRELLRLLFEDGRSVASVARDQEVDQRLLYSRRNRCLATLRRQLNHQGLAWPEVAQALAADVDESELPAA